MTDDPTNNDRPAPQRPVIKVDPAHVPPELHFLISYAEKWGIADSELRRALLKEAPVAELEDLSKTVEAYLRDILKALSFPLLGDAPEAQNFVALLKADARASIILQEMRWREETKAKQPEAPPDNYPYPKIDPAHVPPELHFLIPYAEKWAIADNNLLQALLDEASVAELEDLSTTVKPYISTITKALHFPPLEDTPEERIFVALMMASGGASMELREMRWREEAMAKHREAPTPPANPIPDDKAWVEAVGWPDKYPDPKLNPAHVPPELHPLIPYAEKWGIPDEDILGKLIRQLTLAEADALYAAMYPLWGDIDRFTILNETPDESARHEIDIFTAFRSAFGKAGNIVGDANPKHWLEIIGWPDKYPGAKLDPANVPAELHPLIPLVEKWVCEDDGVREVVVQTASTEDLRALTAAIKQIKESKIRRLAGKMFYDETRKEAGSALVILVEVAELAAFELEDRGDDD